MKACDKLRAYWSKRERDIMLYFPLGSQTKCDGGYLASVLSGEVLAELTRRGYDITTIRFSIEPMKGHRQFASQREEEPKP